MQRLDSRLADGIAYRLELTRRVFGLQQQDFAAKAGISASAYNQYERAKRIISLSHAHKLCDQYLLTLDWIYRGDPSALPYRTAETLKMLRAHHSEPTGTAG